MDAARLKCLFVPVSGPRGTGEYARSLAIATEISKRWPHAEIHFVINRSASYAGSVPFPTTLLPASPTFHPREVAQLIAQLRPTVVIFDNAGRTAQLRAARRAGARVVYVSSRLHQRRKAFRLRWMGLIDEHWIAWPECLAGALTWIERCKLRLRRRPQVRFLDTLLPEADPTLTASTLKRFDVAAGDYVLVAPGGGTSHRSAVQAPAIIARAALRLAARGYPTLMIGLPPPQMSPGESHSLRLAPLMPMAQLVELIRNARLVISNGGDTLLQVLACKRLCIAVPMSPDQVLRLRRLERAGLRVGVPPEVEAIESAAVGLLESEAARVELAGRIARYPVENGMPTVLASVAGLAALCFHATTRKSSEPIATL